ncbi:MAG: hypothetical protein FWD48_08190 [Oscillospiraceae bacterium]|nr:hypothetical protein [Oscillospiraceae bacterium]
MKKLITIALVFVMFIAIATPTSAIPAPLHYTEIRNDEKLAEMRRMAEASEEEFAEYYRQAFLYFNGIENRKELITFLEIVDSIPLPYIQGAQFKYLLYHIPSKRFDISFELEDGARCGFTFYMDKNHSAYSSFENIPASIINREKGVYVYNTFFDGALAVLEINGFLVGFSYSVGFSGKSWYYFYEEFKENVIITSFKDSPWVEKVEVVEVEPEPFTTADVLIILRAVAGMTALTDEEISRFEISETPAASDALRILQIIANS